MLNSSKNSASMTSNVMSICEVYIATGVKDMEKAEMFEKAADRIVFALKLAAKRYSREVAEILFDKYNLEDLGFTIG